MVRKIRPVVQLIGSDHGDDVRYVHAARCDDAPGGVDIEGLVARSGDEDDALSKIEELDMFDSSFESEDTTIENHEKINDTDTNSGGTSNSTPVEGDGFVFTVVNDD